jgi:nitrogen regulatory protein PII
MKRITTILKESEAMAVRRAVCIAGAERIVITPIPYRMCGVDMLDIYSEKLIAAEAGKQVRLEVTADNSRSGSIVSAIRRIVHAGKIILSSRPDMQSRHAS